MRVSAARTHSPGPRIETQILSITSTALYHPESQREVLGCLYTEIGVKPVVAYGRQRPESTQPRPMRRTLGAPRDTCEHPNSLKSGLIMLGCVYAGLDVDNVVASDGESTPTTHNPGLRSETQALSAVCTITLLSFG